LQVAWLGIPSVKVSWEPAFNIPKHLIKEFENEMVISTQDIVINGYGKKTYTTTVIAQTPDVPVTKKSKNSTSALQPIDNKYVRKHNRTAIA